MKTIPRRKFLILTTAIGIFVGLVYSYPDARFMRDAGSAYKGIAPIEFSDQTVYLGRLNAIYKGDVKLRNPAIYEHRRDPVIMPALSEFIEGTFGRIFNLSISQLDMAATFFLPALLFVLVALFMYDLTGLVYVSVAAGLGVLFGTHFFSKVFLFSGKIFNGYYALPLWFSRPITPQMHFIFFLLALIFVYKTLVTNRPAIKVLAGISTGLLFYVSVFYWAYLYSVIGILVLAYLAKKDIANFKALIAVLAVASIVSIPYWLENLTTIKNPSYELLLYRFNIAFTHRPIFPLGAIVLLTCMLVWRRGIRTILGDRTFYFMAAMMAAIILTLNQQVLTGKLFKESHWTTYTGKFAVIVVGSALAVIGAMKILSGKKVLPLKRAAAAIFLVLLSAHAIGLQQHYFNKHFNDNMRLQSMAPVLNWLKANASQADVVLPSPNDIRLSELIPIYTNSLVYYSEPFFCLSLIPADETRYRMLAAYRLFNMTSYEALKHPYSRDGAIFLADSSNRTSSFMENERRKLESEYGIMRDKSGLDLAKRYRLDYIVALKGKDDGLVDKLLRSGREKVYEDNLFYIIKAGGANG